MTEETKLQYKCEHKIIRVIGGSSVRFKCVKCGSESAFMDGIKLEPIKKKKGDT